MMIYGSHGDVEMFVALAIELIERNHKVNLFIITINDRDYSFLSKYDGLNVYQKHFNAEIRNKSEVDVESWKKPLDKQYDLMNKWYKDSVPDITEYSYKFCDCSDILIGSQHIRELPCIAEKYSKPYVSIRVYPAYVRTNYEPPFWVQNVDGKSNSELWDIFESYENRVFKRQINKFRKSIGLEPVKNVLREVVDSKFLNLIGYSKHLWDKKSDWEDTFHLCGYFEVKNKYNKWELPHELKNFIEGDEKPVFITIGSMLEFENDKGMINNLLIEVTKRINRKFIFHSDWGHTDKVDDNVYKISGFISYPELLEYCDLAIHHGGVGTMHIVTKAGCPSVVIEYLCEQPFNAHVLEKKEISSGSIHRSQLCVESLTALIENALKNDQMKEKAVEISKLMKKENGVSTAVDLIEKKIEQMVCL